jgi:hypothetical protein
LKFGKKYKWSFKFEVESITLDPDHVFPDEANNLDRWKGLLKRFEF